MSKSYNQICPRVSPQCSQGLINERFEFENQTSVKPSWLAYIRLRGCQTPIINIFLSKQHQHLYQVKYTSIIYSRFIIELPGIINIQFCELFQLMTQPKNKLILSTSPVFVKSFFCLSTGIKRVLTMFVNHSSGSLLVRENGDFKIMFTKQNISERNEKMKYQMFGMILEFCHCHGVLLWQMLPIQGLAREVFVKF